MPPQRQFVAPLREAQPAIDDDVVAGVDGSSTARRRQSSRRSTTCRSRPRGRVYLELIKGAGLVTEHLVIAQLLDDGLGRAN